MTDLSEVAASVAKVLELRPLYSGAWLEIRGAVMLRRDGSNLTDPYWIWRCVEWLLCNGIMVALKPPIHGGKPHEAVCLLELEENGQHPSIDCHAAEFPARAIHELMTRK